MPHQERAFSNVRPRSCVANHRLFLHSVFFFLFLFFGCLNSHRFKSLASPEPPEAEMAAELCRPQFAESPTLPIGGKVRRPRWKQHSPRFDNASPAEVPSFRGPELTEFEHAIVSENRQGEPWAPLSWKETAVNMGSPFLEDNIACQIGTSSESGQSLPSVPG